MFQDLAFREVPIFTGQGGQQRNGRSKGEQQEGSPPPPMWVLYNVRGEDTSKMGQGAE